MFHTDRDRGSERRVASVVSVSLVRARRRKTETIVVGNILDTVKSDFATFVVEFRDRRELITSSAGDQSPNLAAAPFERRRT